MVRVVRPAHLRTLAKVPITELELSVDRELTQRSVLDAGEQRYPMLPAVRGSGNPGTPCLRVVLRQSSPVGLTCARSGNSANPVPDA